MTTRIVHTTAPKRDRRRRPRAAPLNMPVVVDQRVKRGLPLIDAADAESERIETER
jgi:hypothetical protein